MINNFNARSEYIYDKQGHRKPVYFNLAVHCILMIIKFMHNQSVYIHLASQHTLRIKISLLDQYMLMIRKVIASQWILLIISVIASQCRYS